MGLPGLLKRALAMAAGIVLGIGVVAGVSSWQALHERPGPSPTPPAAVPHERAPDVRA